MLDDLGSTWGLLGRMGCIHLPSHDNFDAAWDWPKAGGKHGERKASCWQVVSLVSGEGLFTSLYSGEGNCSCPFVDPSALSLSASKTSWYLQSPADSTMGRPNRLLVVNLHHHSFFTKKTYVCFVDSYFVFHNGVEHQLNLISYLHVRLQIHHPLLDLWRWLDHRWPFRGDRQAWRLECGRGAPFWQRCHEKDLRSGDDLQFAEGIQKTQVEQIPHKT